MDPITQGIHDYNDHLYAGGEPVKTWDKYPDGTHTPARALHPSTLALCDRKAAYGVMEDLGEIEPDIPKPKELFLDFRIGNIFEDFIAEAMMWKGALVGYQGRLTDGKWKGRYDLLIDPKELGVAESTRLWLVEVKTAKVNSQKFLRQRYPKHYNVAQVDTYVRMFRASNPDVQVQPVLYYVLRNNWGFMLATYKVDGDTIKTYKWNGDGWSFMRDLKEPASLITGSRAKQEEWLETGELPARCGATPDEHYFMCAKTNRNTKEVTPTCDYFKRCWGRMPASFMQGYWDEKEEIPLPF